MPSTLGLVSALSVLTCYVSAQSNTSPVTGKLGDALVVTDNPTSLQYIATFPNSVNSTVRGTVAVVSVPDGTGVSFDVTISGLPEEGGPFPYHIHDQQVSADGNCSGTLAHLDPFIRGESPSCNASAPQTCQVGDLSGKHGTATSSGFSAQYVDLYAALMPGIGAFFGNRSVVVHYANLTRLACANFELIIGNPSSSPSNMTITSITTVASGMSTSFTDVASSVASSPSAASETGNSAATTSIQTTVTANSISAPAATTSLTPSNTANGRIGPSFGMTVLVGVMAAIF